MKLAIFLCFLIVLNFSAFSQKEQKNTIVPIKSIAKETRNQTEYTRSLAIAFLSNPKLADQAVSSLGNWASLSKIKDLQTYCQEEANTDTQWPLLAALDHSRDKLAASSLQILYNHSLKRAKDKKIPSQERYVALKVACRSTGELQTRNTIIQNTVASNELEAFLGELAADKTEDVEIRRIAVKNLSAFKCVSSAEILASIAEDNKSENPVALRKTALLSLPTLDPNRAMDISENILTTTDDKDMFSAAALVLGRSETTRGLEDLVKNASKCPPDSLAIRTAVRYDQDWITQKLQDPSSDELLLALQALTHCQSSRDDLFKPDLINLLRTCDLEMHPEIASELLKRLVTAKLEASDCQEILTILESKSFDASALYPDEYAYFERLARSAEIQESKGEGV